MITTAEFTKKIDSIKLRLVELGEDLRFSIESADKIIETQKVLLDMINNADEITKTILEEFTDATKTAFEKSDEQKLKVKLRLEASERLEDFLVKNAGNDELLLFMYDLLVTVGVEKPVEKIFEEDFVVVPDKAEVQSEPIVEKQHEESKEDEVKEEEPLVDVDVKVE